MFGFASIENENEQTPRQCVGKRVWERYKDKGILDIRGSRDHKDEMFHMP